MKKTQLHAQALAGVLLCLAAALFLYHSLAGGTLLDPNPYDSYTLQAVNWLAGRTCIEDGENYAWLELAIYEGRYYQSFPPVPGLVLLPWAAVFGTAVPANLVIALLALCTAAGVYACFWQSGAEPLTAAFFAVFVGFGSNVFWLSTNGGVWFMAQVCGLCFAVWGLFYALRDTAPARMAASLCLALAVGCRPFYAVLLALWAVWQLRAVVRGRRAARTLVPDALPALLTAAGLMAYNFIRFGSVLEFGHNYLPEFTREADGQFSLNYLWGNLCNLLRPVTVTADLQLEFPLFNGFLFFAANPLFLLWATDALHRDRPRREALPLPVHGGALAAACLAVTLLTCMHRTLGGWQFGARYLVDLFPYVLLWFLARAKWWKPGAPALTLCGLAALFNLYGAVFMLSA